MSAMVLGVTGLPCAGKSFASKLLADGSVTGTPGVLLKADDIGHDILVRPDVVAEMAKRFGSDLFVDAEAAGIRQRIAARVFGKPAELAWLESLVHPLVTAELDAAIAGAGKGTPVVVEAALLTAAGMDLKCDVVVVVEASFATRLRRAAKRGWDRDELERRDRRLAELFDPERLEPLDGKLVRVGNDADDDGLGVRLKNTLCGNAAYRARHDAGTF